MQQILKLTEVKRATGLSGSSIYRLASKGEFPKPIRLTKNGRSSGWLNKEVEEWLTDRIEASRTGTEG